MNVKAQVMKKIFYEDDNKEKHTLVEEGDIVTILGFVCEGQNWPTYALCGIENKPIFHVSVGELIYLA